MVGQTYQRKLQCPTHKMQTLLPGGWWRASGLGGDPETSEEQSGLCEEQLRITADAYCQQWKLRDTGVLEEALRFCGDETPVP